MNPFPISNYVSPALFCDREKETHTLISNIENHSHTAFFAQRRIGKTALIQHVFHLLQKKKMNCIYIDIYATQNIKDFTNQLANSIYQSVPENKSLIKKFLESVRLLRPVITLDEMTGTPQLSLDITQARQFEKTIPQLLHFLDSQKGKTAVAIDEFQQILAYPEKNTEAILRTVMQQMKNVTFIFCGSNQKMMTHLFSDAKRPFYASTKNIHLQKIDSGIYSTFIQKHFRAHKIKAGDDAVALILELTETHTYYTQRLCHELFVSRRKVITQESVVQTLFEILSENEGVYFQYRNLLTASQWNLLKAIAIEGKVYQPYSSEFIRKHQLGTPATVKRGIESLSEKEMIIHDVSLEKPGFEIADKFFLHWLRHKSL